jgi:tetratricopeptide (TPR) repeat protein
VSPDWFNELPPVLFPEATAFSPEALLGLLFCRLNNFEKAYQYLDNETALLSVADIQNRLLHNVLMDDSTLNQPMHFESQHNLAIALLYGHWQHAMSAEEIERRFLQALTLKASRERKAFTVKHYGLFLIDMGRSSDAIELVESFLQSHMSVVAQTEMKAVLCNAWMSQLVVPYDTDLLEKLKTTLWECLQQYEARCRHAETALLLIDASQVANISNSFSESLGYINRAIDILRKEELQELLGSAILRKGMLLYTWAQNGQPQFYRSALQALQDALQTFTRESAPDVFADIHHHLGVVYSEIQDEVKKKAVWAAVSVASFNEALNFYNKVDYPYEFAMICHNFGNAYTRYPAAIHSDNFDKALAWYREALDIRTARDYPLERCNTLFNYLEASWLAANPSEAFNEDRFNEMWAMATELKALAYNDSLKQDADMQIEKLIQLRGAFSQTDIEPQHTNA